MGTEPHPRPTTARIPWAAVLLVCSLGCGYPTVTPDGYEVAKALHNAILQRDAATLPRAEAYLAEARAAGRITEAEYELFTDRIATARAGDWDDAAADLRELLSAQNVEE